MVSVVIPCLDEATQIEAALTALIGSSAPGVIGEIIVVDGGSTDGTPAIIRRVADAHPELSWQLLDCHPPDRGRQLNLGADRARGTCLCFLHADTRLPAGALEKAGRALADPEIALAGIPSIYEVRGRARSMITLCNWAKTFVVPFFFFPVLFWRRGFRLLYGDQTLCCRKEVWRQAGQFGEDVLMEDASFSLSVARRGLGRTVLLGGARARTSGRRRERWGMFRTWTTYFVMTIQWALRQPMDGWKTRYEDVR